MRTYNLSRDGQRRRSADAPGDVAIAALLPNVTLSADGGATPLQLGQLFTFGTGFYSFAANIGRTIFDGMTLLNKQKAAEASLEQGEAQCRTAASTLSRMFPALCAHCILPATRPG
jgi:outer membrane protein TolC